MNSIRKFTNRFLSPIVLFVGCVLAWLVLSFFLEDYQASIGPDFLARIPVKLINLAVALLASRYIIGFLFPTIRRFTNTEGGEKESQFSQQWKVQPSDPRLWISVIVYLGVLFILSQLLLA